MRFAEVRKWLISFNQSCPSLNTEFPDTGIFQYHNDDWGVCLPLYNSRFIERLSEINQYKKMVASAQRHENTGKQDDLWTGNGKGQYHVRATRYEDWLATQPYYSFMINEDIPNLVYIKNFKDNNVYSIDFITLLSLIESCVISPKDTWWECFFLDLYEIWLQIGGQETVYMSHNGRCITTIPKMYQGVSFTDHVDGTLSMSISDTQHREHKVPAVLLKVFNHRYAPSHKRRFKIKTILRYYLGRYNKIVE